MGKVEVSVTGMGWGGDVGVEGGRSGIVILVHTQANRSRRPKYIKDHAVQVRTCWFMKILTEVRMH